MDTDRLILGIAAVFAGVTATLVVLAFVVRQFFFLFVALPFAATTYFMWYQATGRLESNARRRAQRRPSEGRFGAAAGPSAGAGPRGANAGPRTGPGSRRPPSQSTVDISRAEAYRALDLDPSVEHDADEVRRAYRRKVKTVHPDTDTGSEDEFKRVNKAYDRLSR